MLSKTELRRNMIATLQTMTPVQYEKRSAQIVEAFMQLDVFQFAQTIAVTMSNFPEVQTREFIQAAWSIGKTIVVPKSDAQHKTMTFYKLTHFDQLEVAYAGIEEPIVSICEAVEKEIIDVVIVPGVVFDVNGYRIGFGGGFYDRFLTDYYGETIAFAFSEQVTEQVPTHTYDIPVSQIVTDKGIVVRGKSNE